ncbi:MAG: hypothetical protein R2705_06105 [Ilumatobacteraceae bacterium]
MHGCGLLDDPLHPGGLLVGPEEASVRPFDECSGFGAAVRLGGGDALHLSMEVSDDLGKDLLLEEK